MRFVFAIVCFVAAALMMGLGVAQKTVWALPPQVTAATVIESSAPVTVIDGATLNAFPGSQTVTAAGADQVFAAYGRTSDVMAWIGDASFNLVGYDVETGKLTSTLTTGTETELPDPAASDLWLTDYTRETNLHITINVPEDISLVILTDGKAPAPGDISVTWPLDNSTPFAVPLIVGGGVLLLAGLILMLWAISHMRNARGPRRKPQKMPKLPRQPRFKQLRTRSRAIDPKPKGRRSINSSIAAIVPMMLAGALALGGCSTGVIRPPDAEPTATASADALGNAKDTVPLEAPAVTVGQAERIIARIAAVALKADTDKDAALIATRLDGPALQLRLANYTMRAADSSIAALPTIPGGPIKITLPQQRNDWPRTVLAVIENEEDATVPPVVLILIQDDARAPYKIHYAISLEPGAVIPPVAPANVGAGRLGEDTKLLTVPPSGIALAYGDILTLDSESASFDLFEAEGDSLRVAVGPAAKAERQAKLPSTAKLTFENVVGEGQVVALATNDGGALVSVHLNEVETVQPVEAGAAVNAPNTVKALLGKAMSTKGLRAVYGDQLLFYVPSVATGGKIVLLGYSQGLIAASELT